MIIIQSKYNLSQRTTLGIGSIFCKATTNKKAVEKNLKRKLSEHIHSADNFFEIKNIDVETGRKKDVKIISKGIVYCNDILGLIEFIKKKTWFVNCKL